MMNFPLSMTQFLQNALAEDIGSGDVTSLATIPATMHACFVMRAREELVVCGLKFLPELFGLLDHAVSVELLATDGDLCPANSPLARLSGSARSLLATERTALNLVQQLSGVATLTHRYVAAVAGTSTAIVDTRKTIPGMRALQKYAVRCGGGHNHRMGLYDAVLIKDNHIAVVGSVTAAVKAARSAYASATTGQEYSIIVECDTLQQVEEAVTARPDIILLDNMDTATLREAVLRIHPHGIATEASGNVSLSTLRAIAETGVNRISIGKLTHSATAVDIGLDAA